MIVTRRSRGENLITDIIHVCSFVPSNSWGYNAKKPVLIKERAFCIEPH